MSYLLLYLGILKDGGLEGEDGETSAYDLVGILAPYRYKSREHLHVQLHEVGSEVVRPEQVRNAVPVSLWARLLLTG